MGNTVPFYSGYYFDKNSLYLKNIQQNREKKQDIVLDMIKIPYTDEKGNPAEAGKPFIYTITKDDSPWSVACKFTGKGANVKYLRYLNGKKLDKQFWPGKKIVIPGVLIIDPDITATDIFKKQEYSANVMAMWFGLRVEDQETLLWCYLYLAKQLNESPGNIYDNDLVLKKELINNIEDIVVKNYLPYKLTDKEPIKFSSPCGNRKIVKEKNDNDDNNEETGKALGGKKSRKIVSATPQVAAPSAMVTSIVNVGITNDDGLSLELKTNNGLINFTTDKKEEIDFHAGEDYAIPCGTKAVARISGKVSKYCLDDYGKMVIISNDKYHFIYAHMRKRYVKTGQQVKAGDVIGETGNSGLSTGPHVHFEIRKKIPGLHWLQCPTVNPYKYRVQKGIVNELKAQRKRKKEQITIKEVPYTDLSELKFNTGSACKDNKISIKYEENRVSISYRLMRFN